VTDAIATIALGVVFLLAVETLRWMFRPAAKRLRLIKKMKKVGGP
jgi:cbb3-type cytochrome oxidase subunit 3